MKKLFLIVATILVWTASSAQDNFGRTVNYYGVDFSQTKAYGAKETGAQFATAFKAINVLVFKEWDKYNPEKFIDESISIVDISVTEEWNEKVNPKDIITNSSNYILANSDISEMVKRYEIEETDGVGLVIICELLNKENNMGNYTIVFFDIASREVLYNKFVVGKAKGFGLRNFWARSLLNAMKSY